MLYWAYNYRITILFLIVIINTSCDKCDCENINIIKTTSTSPMKKWLGKNEITKMKYPMIANKKDINTLFGQPVDSLWLYKVDGNKYLPTNTIESYLYLYLGDTIQYSIFENTGKFHFIGTDVTNSFTYLELNNVQLESNLNIDEIFDVGGCNLECNSRVITEPNGTLDLKIMDSALNISLQFKDEKLIAFQIFEKNN